MLDGSTEATTMELDTLTDGEADRRQPRVLIVDDDPAALKFLTDRCVKMGMSVQTATNGLQALIIARRTRPDALIVDVHMPELDGLSLCSRLLEPNQAGIDVIVVSGYSDADCSDRCDSLGAAFVRKGPALWSSIQTCLHEMFPGMSVEVAAAAAASRPSAQLRERPLVLVIDDDPDVGRFLDTRLRKCGVDVMFAADGRQGYHVAAREKPTVILSDYFMPVADINFLLWRLRSTPALERIPVLAMSGKALDKTTAEGLVKGDFARRGVERIFRKPLDIDELFTEIKKHCALDYTPSMTPPGRSLN
jgi:CheY-like chemotaxis protein